MVEQQVQAQREEYMLVVFKVQLHQALILLVTAQLQPQVVGQTLVI